MAVAQQQTIQQSEVFTLVRHLLGDEDGSILPDDKLAPYFAIIYSIRSMSRERTALAVAALVANTHSSPEQARIYLQIAEW